MGSGFDDDGVFANPRVVKPAKKAAKKAPKKAAKKAAKKPPKPEKKGY